MGQQSPSGAQQITAFDRPVAKALGLEVERELAALCERHGIAVQYAGGSFSAVGEFTMKMRFKTGDADAKQEDGRARQFRQYASMYGLEADDLGQKVCMNGRTFEIAGLDFARRKNCIHIRRDDGKEFVASPEALKPLLEQARRKVG